MHWSMRQPGKWGCSKWTVINGFESHLSNWDITIGPQQCSSFEATNIKRGWCFWHYPSAQWDDLSIFTSFFMVWLQPWRSCILQKPNFINNKELRQYLGKDWPQDNWSLADDLFPMSCPFYWSHYWLTGAMLRNLINCENNNMHKQVNV